tara:strand:+ start:163 stop:360 length:198 start_codon:yes stop_codon:yes gene_type:complete
MTKKRTQNKENYYYYFWSALTIIVVSGQIYIGNSYRQLSQDLRDLTEVITIKIELDEMKGSKFIY